MPASAPMAAVNRQQITIEASGAFEIVMALGSLHYRPYRLRDWVDRTRALLGPEIMAEVDYFSGQTCSSLTLTEFPVDFRGDPTDVAGFVKYIERMSHEDFLYYLTGRVIPREKIAASLADPPLAFSYIRDFYHQQWSDMTESLDQSEAQYCDAILHIGVTQRRAVALLRAFYERVFKAELPRLSAQWQTALVEQRALFERMDPESYMVRLMNGRPFPAMFPEGTPVREIRVVPSVYTWKTNMDVFGYGTVVEIFDSSVSETRRSEIDQSIDELTRVTSALSDPTRLRILRSIVQDSEVYGHKLARLHGISQPAVSRHMGILKHAGLVVEEPRDGKITYRLNREPIERLCGSLFHFIED